MKVNPPKPYNNGSYAETKIFDAFRHVHMLDAICFNSLHLVYHRNKKMSEIDFLVVCSNGIFVFEVKGGRVFQLNGKWYTRSKQINKEIDNPFNQSRGALFALLDSLKSKGLINPKIPFGYGVLLPNTIKFNESIEFDPTMLGTQDCLKRFGPWLESFINFWVNKVNFPEKLNSYDIYEIANYLRPGSFIEKKRDDCHGDNLNLKQEQVVRAFQSGKRIICEGAASTGKTHLIEILAKKHINKDQKLLILCSSKWLKEYLKFKLKKTNIVVATIESVFIDSRRAFISHYDILIVDDAQDIYHEFKIKTLDSYIKGGLKHGQWAFFQDLDNHHFLFELQDNKIINNLTLASEVRLSLELTYRYSNDTLNYLPELIRFEKENIIKKPTVEIFISKNEQTELNYIKNIISSSISSGYSYSDITVISNKSFCHSSIYKLRGFFSLDLIQLDDYNIKHFPLNGISFSFVSHFKGLENKIIILLDFNEREIKKSDKAYFSLTRASEHLYIVLAATDNDIPRGIENASKRQMSEALDPSFPASPRYFKIQS